MPQGMGAWRCTDEVMNADEGCFIIVENSKQPGVGHWLVPRQPGRSKPFREVARVARLGPIGPGETRHLPGTRQSEAWPRSVRLIHAE
jgi:hypothetical protein